ncbi:F-box protein CPR1-like [Vigna unguiculata]|uniref:F-box domain-containing protein n=1 Tax=Vigna unguiculata TaxID=3917 RepID=A0A4D6NRH8_VIGUN|nr:F-box protein CPR1-like [Vigna unguiculata]QCE15988.1 hypothetical protein DEO72_LG11g3001 [Vigna unguiculata]
MKTGDSKRKKTKIDSPLSVDVNEDLVKEILLKLPTKSVLSFKGLSKSWFSLISDPEFARRHFDAAVAPTYKLLNIVKDCAVYCADKESALCDDDSWHAVSNISGFHWYVNCISVAGSCRGFVLLQYLLHDFVLWNPLTGVQKEIHQKRGTWTRHHLSGMGYDPVDDDIVLVTIILRIHDGNHMLLRYFSLRNNCWTSVKYDVSYVAPYFGAELRHGQLWNETLYWIVKSADDLRNVMIAFDVREKRLLEITLPHHLANLPNGSDIYHLKVMGEYLYLCLVVRNHPYQLIEIWSVKECKQETVWTKTFDFSFYFRPSLNLIFPVCFTENGEILAFCNNNTLVKIDEKGKLRYGNQNNSRLHFLRCVMYRESFLPLPGDEAEPED